MGRRESRFHWYTYWLSGYNHLEIQCTCIKNEYHLSHTNLPAEIKIYRSWAKTNRSQALHKFSIIVVRMWLYWST